MNFLTKIKNSIINRQNELSFFINDKSYTYKEFGKIVSDVNQLLIRKKIENQLIGVITHDSLETYSSLIGILFSGNGYIPIDPNYPHDRVDSIIKQAGINIIITDNDFDSKKLQYNNRIDIINIKKNESDDYVLEISPVSLNSIAYIVFTSGSTGLPNGVCISFENINAYVESFENIGWNLDAEDKFLQLSNLTFDMSIITYLIPLCYGASIYTVSQNNIKYMKAIDLLLNSNITFCAIVPSVISYLRPYFDEINIEKLKYFLVGGESVSLSLIREWSKCIPNAEIVIMYGPTETTVFSHIYTVKKNVMESKNYNGILSIGNSLKNIKNIVVDENMNIVGKNIKGELCIAGEQVMLGYLNNPQKNHLVFINKTIGDEYLKFYRTGDLVFLDDDEYLQYCGRIDHQFKIEGHRVELGEIEKHVRDFTSIYNVAAIGYKTKLGIFKIHLFIENYKGEYVDIKGYLQDIVPKYMIPTAFTSLSILPLNVNGKIDRLALQKIAETEN
jgi:D-alanine--poly(phosphoribitol) ligase subunit 1